MSAAAIQTNQEATSITSPTSRSFMPKHASMPLRIQKTPYGDVSLTSRWMRDRYYLMAYGSDASLRWMFEAHIGNFESASTGCVRHSFPPANFPITVERVLRTVCAKWQTAWDDRLATHLEEQVISSNGEVVVPELRTLSQLIEHYKTVRADELAPATNERNRHYLARWEAALGADLALVDLSETRLLAARGALAKELKPSSLNCMLATFKAVLRWAEARSIAVAPAYRSLKGVREVANAPEKAWWRDFEVEAALVAAADVDRELKEKSEDPNAKQREAQRRRIEIDGGPGGTAIILIALGCIVGVRWEEIIMLRWEDLDLDARDQRTDTPAPVVHIVGKDGWVPKGGKNRTVPMHHRLVEILKPFRKPTGWVLNPYKIMPKNEGTKRVYRYNPIKIFNKVLERLAASSPLIKPITPHGMRHSFASNLLMAGVSDVLVARWLGHCDTALVHSRYGHLMSYHNDINRVQLGSGEPAGGGG